MTILANDIKLVASRVMDDFPEGGGAPTATVIVDGASNAIFADISELDRAGGDVSLRKLFVHVQTNNTDTYLGANVIVAEPPTDPNVSVTLFSTGQTFDERQDASGRVESYLVQASEWPGFLLENHISGQRSITLFQRPEEEPPGVGETLVLVYNEGLSSERQQYVRVIDTTSVVRTFVDEEGRLYVAANVSCDISDPLRYDFPGSGPSSVFRKGGNTTKVRQTSVGDAASYSSVSPTTVAVEIGDISVSVDSIFTQLVPSAQTEIPLADQSAAGQSATLTPGANGAVSYTSAQPFDSDTSLSLGNAVMPGSLLITLAGGATLNDVGGTIFSGASQVGVIDYARGIVSFPTLAAPYTGLKTVAFEPAAAPLRVADTAQIPVTQATRSFNYNLTILPAPAPGTVTVSYRSQGRWYDLRDNAGGVLRGSDTSFGIGTINYATGTASVTLGSLPDDGSAVLFAWGTSVNYLNRADIAVPSPSVRLQLPVKVQPSSVLIEWNDGTPKSAVDDGAGGISGDAQGTVDYASGLVEIRPATLPVGGQEYTVSHSVADPASAITHTEASPIRETDTRIIVDLGQTGVTPGTVRMSWPIALNPPAGTPYNATRNIPSTNTARDDGDGNVIDSMGRVAGTIVYATGLITFQPDGSVTGTTPQRTWVTAGGGYGVPASANGTYIQTGVTYLPIPAIFPTGGSITVVFQAGGTPSGSAPTVFANAGVKFDITNRYGEQIVPGSVNFLLSGKRYFDRLGALYNSLDLTTGAATLAGTINYTTGEVTLSDWTPGASATLDIDSLVTTTGDHTVSGATFRIPVSPVRPGSLQILAARADGGTINVTADPDGSIAGAGVRGSVEYDLGIVSLEFGQMVTAAGKEGEEWYRVGDIVGGMIWEPAFAFADTVRYNAIAFSYLPLDAGVLGLDPVRLPQDGRVPIFRPGGFAVIGHTKTTAPATVTNGQTVNLDRVRLSRVRVLGENGLSINTGYTVDLEAGLVTFTDVTGYDQPVTIEDRIEDMAQISDVQISGQLSFTRQITHEYPVGSFVSSALIVNDMKARVSTLFDQSSWDQTTWSDIVVGVPATAAYNSTLAPVEVTNRGAITERWALRFISNTTFQVIGEHVGVIDNCSINSVCSPINPATETPYFTVREIGWGSGWSVGNIVRLNTIGAQFPIWVVRTVQQGATTVEDDQFTILVRGDVDRP